MKIKIMADYQIDPFLKQALERGSINRVVFDIEHRRVTIWHNSASIRDEVEKSMSKHYDFQNKARPVLKSEYAFNVLFELCFRGMWPSRNEAIGSEFKTEFVFDLSQQMQVKNMED